MDSVISHIGRGHTVRPGFARTHGVPPTRSSVRSRVEARDQSLFALIASFLKRCNGGEVFEMKILTLGALLQFLLQI